MVVGNSLILTVLGRRRRSLGNFEIELQLSLGRPDQARNFSLMGFLFDLRVVFFYCDIGSLSPDLCSRVGSSGFSRLLDFDFSRGGSRILIA